MIINILNDAKVNADTTFRRWRVKPLYYDYYDIVKVYQSTNLLLFQQNCLKQKIYNKTTMCHSKICSTLIICCLYWCVCVCVSTPLDSVFLI